MNSCSWFSKFSLFLKLLIRIFFVLLNKVYSIFSFYFFNFWIKTSQVSNNTTCIFQRADCWTLCFFFFSVLRHVEFPDQGAVLRHSCDLCCVCGDSRPFHPLCLAGNWTCVPAFQKHHWSRCATAETPIGHFCTLLFPYSDVFFPQEQIW